MATILNNTENREKLITIKRASEILSLAPKTIYNGRGGTSHLTRVRQGRTVRLLLREVMEHRTEAIERAARLTRKSQ